MALLFKMEKTAQVMVEEYYPRIKSLKNINPKEIRGIFLLNASPKLENIIVDNNTADIGGGGEELQKILHLNFPKF